jgi:hypothetical protein
MFQTSDFVFFAHVVVCRWVTLGLLAVENIRGAQAYNIPSPVELRYLSLQMHGSYGKETFCTMSGVQVHKCSSCSPIFGTRIIMLNLNFLGFW